VRKGSLVFIISIGRSTTNVMIAGCRVRKVGASRSDGGLRLRVRPTLRLRATLRVIHVTTLRLELRIAILRLRLRVT